MQRIMLPSESHYPKRSVTKHETDCHKARLKLSNQTISYQLRLLELHNDISTANNSHKTTNCHPMSIHLYMLSSSNITKSKDQLSNKN